MPNTVLSQSVETMTESTGLSLIWILVISLILNYLLPGGMKYMIFLIRTLQMILHMPMMMIIFPANVSILMSNLFPIVMFDVLELTESFDASLIFQFDEQGQEKLKDKMLD
jgi:hypothetical protein